MASYDELDSLLDTLTEAAIDAHMWELGFKRKEGSVYINDMTWAEIHRGDPGANEDADYLDIDCEAEVFNFWPGEIEKFFAAWRDDVIPHPEAFDGMIDAIGSARAAITLPSRIESPRSLRHAGPVEGGGELGGLVTKIQTHTGDMKGSWIEAFHEHYAVPLPYVIGNLGAMLDVLQTGVKNEQAMWKEVRQNVADLAEAGTEWFKHTSFDGNVWELVVGVAKTMYDTWSFATSYKEGDPKGVIEDGFSLFGDLTDLPGLIEDNKPPDEQETGLPNDVEGVRVKIAQTLEYRINRHISYTEERLTKLLGGMATAMRGTAGTYSMGDQHLDGVADAGKVLAPEQSLSEHGVSRTVSSLFALADQVWLISGSYSTTVYPFVRPGSIGTGSRGPYDAVLELENTINDMVSDTAHNLEKVASAVRIAADYAFAADAESGTALGKANTKLDEMLKEMEHDVLPGDRALPPYTPPDEELHVEVPDCLPEDPFPGSEPEQPFVDGNGPLAPVG